MSERPKTCLVLGGARSGKSGFAQAQAEASQFELVFVATAEPRDEEMRARIADHAATRGARWQTIEAPFDLMGTLVSQAAPQRLLLVDCLTLWLSNIMLRGDDIVSASAALVSTVSCLGCPTILVSNEVGSGIVPETPLGRRFRDAQGRLNQQMARVATDVVLMVSGLPVVLKPSPPPICLFRAPR